MNIGIDFDGVLLDTERYLRFYAEYYSYFCLGNKPKISNEFVDQQLNFAWTKEEQTYFLKKYMPIATKHAPFIPGAKQILAKLKKEGHKLFLITARYNSVVDEFELAKPRIKSLGIDFDGIYSGRENKYEVCKKFNIDLMIDDGPNNVEDFAGKDITILFFKDVARKFVPGNNIKLIDTWVDVYREVQKLCNKKTS